MSHPGGGKSNATTLHGGRCFAERGPHGGGGGGEWGSPGLLGDGARAGR